MRQPFFAGSKKHENDSVVSQGMNKYQCDAGLMPAASLWFRKIVSISLKNTLEQPGEESFLKNRFSLAAVDSHDRCSCIKKLAASRGSSSVQRGTEWRY